MADNITVRTGDGPAPTAGTDGSAKKSKLEQQVEALGERIKHRTGRAVDDDVLRAMVLRKQARAERAERSAESQQTYLKTTANETLQAQKTDDKGTLIGRPREMNTPDGLSRHQRQLVTSDPNAPTILPPATHPPITAEAASNVLEKIFSFLKPGSADAAPLTVEHYSETLVPREPTQPRESSAEGDAGHPGGHLADSGQNRGLRSAEEKPQRPLPEGGEGADGTDPPADRPTTTGRPTTGERPERPILNRPTAGQPANDGRPQRPDQEGGRPVTPGGGEPTVPRPPAQNTIHLPKKREPEKGEQPKTPTHSDATPLGRTVMANAKTTDASGRTPLGQTTLATTPGPTGPTLPTRPVGPNVPTGTTGPNVPTGQRPGSSGGNLGGPVAGRGTRSARPMPNETSSGGTTLSLRGSRSGRTTRATDVTTEAASPFVNNGGGFDTTTSWDGMNFNWEAFFVKFMFQFQKDEAEARRLMKELRNAMHKLAQEGIKAKIALEKMNQAFERAEAAFKLGDAMKGVMDSAQQAAQQQGQQQQPGAQGPNGQQQPGAQPTGQTDPAAAAAVPPDASAAGDAPPGQPRPGQPGPGQTRSGPARPGQTPTGPQPAADPSSEPAAAAPDPANAPGGDQQQPGQTRGNQRGRGQGQGQQDDPKMPGGGLVGNVSEHLRTAMEKANAELISSAQRGGSEMDARIRSTYMQAQGLFNQMVQLLAMSRSK